MSARDVAVVTGAARGIGYAIAERFAAGGYRLLLLDVSPEVVDSAAQLSDATGVAIDIRDRDAVKRTLADIAADARIAALVNCAGSCARTSFEAFTPEEWQRDIDTNLTSMFFLTQAVVFPYMRDQRYGRIVNIASVSGKVGGLGRIEADGGGRSGPAYAASKAGVINLTRWIAREVGQWNITCNAVAPGPIATPMTSGHEANYDFDASPVRRFGRPDEVADAVAYLAHPERGYTTGVCLHVDGGLVLA